MWKVFASRGRGPSATDPRGIRARAVRRSMDATRRPSDRAAERSSRGVRRRGGHRAGKRHRGAAQASRALHICADRDRSAGGAVHPAECRGARDVPLRVAGPENRIALRGRRHTARRFLRRFHGKPVVDGSNLDLAHRGWPAAWQGVARGDQVPGTEGRGRRRARVDRAVVQRGGRGARDPSTPAGHPGPALGATTRPPAHTCRQSRGGSRRSA